MRHTVQYTKQEKYMNKYKHTENSNYITTQQNLNSTKVKRILHAAVHQIRFINPWKKNVLQCIIQIKI